MLVHLILHCWGYRKHLVAFESPWVHPQTFTSTGTSTELTFTSPASDTFLISVDLHRRLTVKIIIRHGTTPPINHRNLTPYHHMKQQLNLLIPGAGSPAVHCALDLFYHGRTIFIHRVELLCVVCWAIRAVLECVSVHHVSLRWCDCVQGIVYQPGFPPLGIHRVH